MLPFYRIYFDDGTFFDYDADPANVRAQIARLAPEDLDGYERFHEAARAIFQRGFLELGYTYFGDLASMLRVVPDLLKLGAVKPLFSLVSQYFKSDKMRQVFSFEPLLIGGNPLKVPAIYAMIHFVEKTWGIHYAMGGTGALVRALVRKFEELGGSVRLNAEVTSIDVAKRGRKRIATGVTLASGETLAADLVVSNADYATTYLKLVDKAHRRINRDALVKFRKQSMSLLVIYFGYAMRDGDPDLRHHNIILGPRYEELLTDIFERKILAEDFSQYLHLPTMSDPSMAPPGTSRRLHADPGAQQSERDRLGYGRRAVRRQGAAVPGGARLYPRSARTAGLPQLRHPRSFRARAGVLCRQRLRGGAAADADRLLPPAQPERGRDQPVPGGAGDAAGRRDAVGDDVGEDDRTGDRARLRGRSADRRLAAGRADPVGEDASGQPGALDARGGEPVTDRADPGRVVPQRAAIDRPRPGVAPAVADADDRVGQRAVRLRRQRLEQRTDDRVGVILQMRARPYR